MIYDPPRTLDHPNMSDDHRTKTKSNDFYRADTSARNANHLACREATDASLRNIGQVSNGASNHPALAVNSIRQEFLEIEGL